MSSSNKIKQADRVKSKKVRLRDMIPGTTLFRCISCGLVKPIREADCGHYISRRHMSTRFNDVNCNAQCKECNRYEDGNVAGYREGLVSKYGEDTVIRLESQKNEMRKFTDAELDEIIAEDKAEIKRILKERGLTIKCLTE